MLKYQLWDLKNFNGKQNVLIEPEYVNVMFEYDAGDFIFNVTSLDEVNNFDKEKFKKKFKEIIFDYFETEDIANLLEEFLGIKVTVHEPEIVDYDYVYVNKNEKIIGINSFGDIYTSEHADEIYVYRYFDGNNFLNLTIDPAFVENLVVTSDYYSLDEWDGNNFTTNGTGNHEQVHKILNIDGEKVDEPLYLIHKWSQWQGSLPSGKVVSESELIHHLEELERDVEEYMSVIRHL